MSTPETPSTSAWWLLVTSAKRPPSTLSTSHISHSGFERSSRCENTRAARIAQLLLAARAREGGVADVVLEVELRVVDPLRPALAEGARCAASGGTAAPGAGASAMWSQSSS